MDKTSHTYCVSKKKRPILYGNSLYKIGHYFMDTQYDTVISQASLENTLATPQHP